MDINASYRVSFSGKQKTRIHIFFIVIVFFEVNIRFNLLLTKTEGGDPIINGKTIEVKQDEVWICAAGMFPHSTTEITGEEPRIMISFGHSIENTLLNKII